MGSKWLESCLSDHINIKHGYAFKGEFFKAEPTSDYLLTPGNFSIGGGFKADKFKYYDGPVPEDYVLKQDDLVVTMTDLSKEADTLGFAALVPEIPNHRLLHNQRVGLVQFKTDDLDPTYLYFLLRSHAYRHHVISSATGTTVKHTSPSKILSYRFMKPPFEEQIRIGKNLILLEEKIQLNRKINQTLEQMAQALFKSWFVDFDPVMDKLLASGKPIPDGLKAHSERRSQQLQQLAQDPDHKPLADDVLALFPDEFELVEQEGGGIGGWVPKGWRVSPVGEVIENVGGGTPSTKELAYWQDGTNAFCTPKDMSSLQSKVLLGTERNLTEAGVGKVSSGVLPEGTVLMSSRAPIGYLAISQIPVTVNQGIIAMKPNMKYSSEYILCWAESSMDEIVARANGSTFLEISKRNFRDIPFLEPDFGVCEAFSGIASSMFSKVSVQQKNTGQLEKLRDTLLPKLISGEIRIPDIDDAA